MQSSLSNTVLLLGLVAVLLWVQLKATWRVLRDPYSERSQRLMQLALIWLLPGVGAVVVLAVHRPEEKHSGKYRDVADPPDDAALLGRGRRPSDSSDDD